MTGMFHQKGDVDCLYSMRKDGERGMISVEDCVRMKEKNLAMYIMRSKEGLFGVVSEGMEVEECGKEYKKRVMVDRKEKLKKKQVHGKILNDIEEVGTKETGQWLQGRYITKSTRWFRSRIQKEDVSPKCRLCDVEIETVCHLSAGCTNLSKGPYKRRYDQMGLKVYWELCWKY